MQDTKKYKTLVTEYAEEMNTDMPWCEYPRPQLVRDSFLCLNGEWDFTMTESPKAPKVYGGKILVPFPPESYLSGVERSHNDGEFLYYRRKFSLPVGFLRDRIILHIGAVDQICELFVNGTVQGVHEGGYLPFSADITEALTDGENEIVLKVTDNLSHIYPYGKQRLDRGGMWYTPVSGIWQTVWLESLPKNPIEAIKITPSMTGAKIEVRCAAKSKRLTLRDSGEVYEFSGESFTVTLKEPRLWSPEEPYLYHFTLETDCDKVESYFALREVEIKKKDGIPRIFLNGKPYFFNGLLDQGYFPDGIFLPATSRAYEEDIKLAKSLGYNMLRKHIKIEPPIFYHLCDRLGMIVFQDMINNSDYSFFTDTALPTIGLKKIRDNHLHRDKRSRDMFERSMYGTLEALYNCPCILYYTIFNEGWGQFCADEMYEKAKAADPTRIYDATSGWFVQNKSDVDSRHVYFKRIKLGKLQDRPIIISEFGGYAHRVVGHLFGSANYGYRQYEKIGEYEAAIRTLYKDEIKPLIKKGISGLVFTQLSDVEDETNGLVTYDRRVVKLDKTMHKALMDELAREIK